MLVWFDFLMREEIWLPPPKKKKFSTIRDFNTWCCSFTDMLFVAKLCTVCESCQMVVCERQVAERLAIRQFVRTLKLPQRSYNLFQTGFNFQLSYCRRATRTMLDLKSSCVDWLRQIIVIWNKSLNMHWMVYIPFIGITKKAPSFCVTPMIAEIPTWLNSPRRRRLMGKSKNKENCKQNTM